MAQIAHSPPVRPVPRLSGITGWDRAEEDRPRIELVEETSGGESWYSQASSGEEEDRPRIEPVEEPSGGESWYSQDGGPRIEPVEESDGDGGESWPAWSRALPWAVPRLPSMEEVSSRDGDRGAATPLLRAQVGQGVVQGGVPITFPDLSLKKPPATLEVLRGTYSALKALGGGDAQDPEEPDTHTYTWRPPPPAPQPEYEPQACLLGWKDMRMGGRDDSPEWRWPSRRDPCQLVPTHNLLGEVVGGSSPISAAAPTWPTSTFRSYPVSKEEEFLIRRWMANDNQVTFEAAWRLPGAVVPLPDRPTGDKCGLKRPRLVGFHGTSVDAIEGILRYGFAEPTRKGLLGKRVYLSPDCSKAAHYSATKSSNLLLVCHFDPGSMLVVGDVRQRDSSNGWTGGEGEQWDTVKGIPPFLRATPAEYGVKEPRRISPAYVLQFNHPKLQG